MTNDGRVVEVNWDDAGHPPQFSASSPPLSRVDFSGRSVLQKSTGQFVALLNPVAGATPMWHCQIFSQARAPFMANIPEADLRPMPVTDPLERFRAGDIGSTKRYLLRQVAHQYRMQNLQDDLVSLGQSQVAIQPHQVSVVHRVITNYPAPLLAVRRGGSRQDHRGWNGDQGIARQGRRTEGFDCCAAKLGTPVAFRNEVEVQ